jgi:hypothetical protein
MPREPRYFALALVVSLTACGVSPGEESPVSAPKPTPPVPAIEAPSAPTTPPAASDPVTDPPPPTPSCASQCAVKHGGANNVHAWTCDAKDRCVIAACAGAFRNCDGLVDDGCELVPAGGRCAAIKLQGPTGGSPRAITTSDTEIYWLTTTMAVRHCPKAGCPSFAEFYLGFQAYDFVAVGDDLVFAAWPGIIRCPGTGCGSAKTVIVADDEAMSITESAGNLYWMTNGGKVRSCPVTGCGPNGPVDIATGSRAQDIAVSNDFVAWAPSMKSVQVCPLAGCANGPTNLGGVATGYLSTVHLLGGNVYWAGGSQINVCPTTGCTTPTKLTASNGGAFQIDDQNVYFAHGYVVERCPLAGCSASGPSVMLGAGEPGYGNFPFAQDDTMLYLIGYNTVYKLAK